MATTRLSATGRPRLMAVLRRLGAVSTIAVVLVTSMGPLSPTIRAIEPGRTDDQQSSGDGRADARVVEAAPVDITTPASGGGNVEADPSIGGPPLFLPYTAPADVSELEDERSGNGRALANPDGSFTLEVSDGPINFRNEAGGWTPIDLSLVADDASAGYQVAAHPAKLSLGTKDGELGAMEMGGHRVSLAAKGFTDAEGTTTLSD